MKIELKDYVPLLVESSPNFLANGPLNPRHPQAADYAHWCPCHTPLKPDTRGGPIDLLVYPPDLRKQGKDRKTWKGAKQPEFESFNHLLQTDTHPLTTSGGRTVEQYYAHLGKAEEGELVEEVSLTAITFKGASYPAHCIVKKQKAGNPGWVIPPAHDAISRFFYIPPRGDVQIISIDGLSIPAKPTDEELQSVLKKIAPYGGGGTDQFQKNLLLAYEDNAEGIEIARDALDPLCNDFELVFCRKEVVLYCQSIATAVGYAFSNKGRFSYDFPSNEWVHSRLDLPNSTYYVGEGYQVAVIHNDTRHIFAGLYFATKAQFEEALAKYADNPKVKNDSLNKESAFIRSPWCQRATADGLSSLAYTEYQAPMALRQSFKDWMNSSFVDQMIRSRYKITGITQRSGYMYADRMRNLERVQSEIREDIRKVERDVDPPVENAVAKVKKAAKPKMPAPFDLEDEF